MPDVITVLFTYKGSFIGKQNRAETSAFCFMIYEGLSLNTRTVFGPGTTLKGLETHKTDEVNKTHKTYKAYYCAFVNDKQGLHTMYKPILKQCPHCLEAFQAKRKNQLYCTTECRTDANNAVAKSRYANFKEGAPKVNAVKSELKKLREYVASLTIILSDIKEVDRDTIMYGGHSYKRTARVHHPVGIQLSKGVGVMMPGNKIIYNSAGLGSHTERVSEYVLQR